MAGVEKGVQRDGGVGRKSALFEQCYGCISKQSTSAREFRNVGQGWFSPCRFDTCTFSVARYVHGSVIQGFGSGNSVQH